MLNGTDSRINYSLKSEVTWSEPINEDGISSLIMASGVSGILVLIGAVVWISKRRSGGEEKFYEEEIYHEDESINDDSQPSAYSGPPATTEIQTEAMTEYQRQLEEYNRQMAEYNAWQQAQGSQAVNDTNTHE